MTPSALIHPRKTKLYGDKDPRDLPRYTYVEVARATGVPPTTVGAWVRGQWYSTVRRRKFANPVIRPPDGDGRLSFFNLIEVHILRGLREDPRRIRLQTIRDALDVAEAKHSIDRLLIHEDLRVGAGELFLSTLGKMEHLTNSAQLVMRDLFESALERVLFDGKLPTDFWPMERITERGAKLLLVSPQIAFGRPIIKRLGVSTRSIADRVNAGESEDSILADVGLHKDEMREALALESAA